VTGNSTPVGNHRTPKGKSYRERLVRIPAILSYPILALDHFFADQGTVRAAALTYTTLLALVPMLAFSFAILRGLGFAEELFGIIFNQLGPVFDPQIRDRLYSYITRVNVSTLGTTGLAAFLLSAILTLNTIEKALNVIFEVKHSRPLVRKFTDYFTILFLTPLLLGITLSATTVFQIRDWLAPLGEHWILTTGAEVLLKMVPILASVVLFMYILMVIPNKYVSFKSAFMGGIIGGVLWFYLQWGYVSFQVGFSRYEAIFGALAQLPILMVWIYFAWCILIYSAELAAIVDGRTIRLQRAGNSVMSQVSLETAFLVMTSIASRSATRHPPWTIGTLAENLNLPLETLKSTVECLQNKGLIDQSETSGGLLLVRHPATIFGTDILDAVEETSSLQGELVDGRVHSLLDEIHQQRRQTLENVTLENLRRKTTETLEPSLITKSIRPEVAPAAVEQPSRNT
jgi:membrane protein